MTAATCSDVLIRLATREDADSVARLMTELGYTTGSDQMRDRFENILNNAGYATFVAAMNDEIVGVIGACVAPLYEDDLPLGRIAALCIANSARRLGIGARLISEAEGWLWPKGVGTIAISSGTHRADAHKFYERLGYKQVGLGFKKML